MFTHCNYTWVEVKNINLSMLELQSLTILYLFQLYCHKASIMETLCDSLETFCSSSVYIWVKPLNPL